MGKMVRTTYYCDNTRQCSSALESACGLPIGWVSITYRPVGNIQKHRHYCCLRCLSKDVVALELDEETHEL